MNKVAAIAGSGILSLLLALPCAGQAPTPKPPKPAPETPESAANKAAEAARKAAFYTAKAKEITDQLHSKTEADNAAGLAALKEWIASDQKDGAKALLANANYMLWDKRYSAGLPELLDSVADAQKDPPFLAKIAIYKGYALQDAGKQDEGNKIVAKAFIEHPNEAGNVAGTDIIKGLQAQKRTTEVMELSLKLIMAKPDSADTVDHMIKLRVGILNGANKEQDALGELKRLFNACPMDKTAAALTSIDQQLRLISVSSGDASVIERFHKEQLEGADAGAATQPGAANEPTVMAGIKVSGEGFDTAMDAFDSDSFQGAERRCMLMLLGNKGDEALKWAKRAFGQANNPPQVKTATDLIARCLKTQDGNVGRANAWVTSNAPKKPQPK